MRKTFVLLLGAAFVATLPSIASAKTKRHKHPRNVAMQPADPQANTGRFVGAALRQVIVPVEVTFGPRRYQ